MDREQTPETKPSRGVAVLKIAISLIFLALVFIVAGTVSWPEFWIFLGFYFMSTAAFMVWLKKHDPRLFRERVYVKKDTKSWDKNIIRAYTGLLAAMLLLAPLDAVRLHWSRVPSIFRWLAGLGILVSWGIVMWAFRENAFLSGFVRIQTDRGQTVCDTGPYRFIRHPMYLAVILAILCLPLYLGSYYSLIPAAVAAALFVLRTSLEDRALRKELPGYEGYAARVRWMLIPNVW